MNNTTKVTIRTLANMAAVNVRYARNVKVGGMSHAELMAAARAYKSAAKIAWVHARFNVKMED
jgi:hypothetical protein